MSKMDILFRNIEDKWNELDEKKDALKDRIENNFIEKHGDAIENAVEKWDHKLENSVEAINKYFENKETLVKIIIFGGVSVVQTAFFSICVTASLISPTAAHGMKHAMRCGEKSYKTTLFQKYQKNKRITDIFNDDAIG